MLEPEATARQQPWLLQTPSVGVRLDPANHYPICMLQLVAFMDFRHPRAWYLTHGLHLLHPSVAHPQEVIQALTLYGCVEPALEKSNDTFIPSPSVTASILRIVAEGIHCGSAKILQGIHPYSPGKAGAVAPWQSSVSHESEKRPCSPAKDSV